MPPSTGYRFTKFVRRNRVTVAAGTFLLLGLLAGLTVALVAFRRATAAEAEARANLASLESSEQFLIDLFDAAKPGESLGDDPPASELLARGIDRLDALEDRPRVQARLLYGLGEVQRRRGDFGSARELLERAETHYRETVPDPIELAATLKRLGSVRRLAHEFQAAEVALTDAAALFAQHAPDDERYLATRNELGMIQRRRGRLDEAAATYQSMIDDAQRLGLEPMTIAIFRFNAATALTDALRFEEAVSQMSRSLEIMAAELPANHPNLAIVHGNLAVSHGQLGRLRCALAHNERALAIERTVLSADHPNLAVTLDERAGLLAPFGDLDGAEELLAEAKRIVEAAFPDGGPRHAEIDFDLAELRFLQGRYDEAIDGIRRGLAKTDEFEPDQPVVGTHARAIKIQPRLHLAAALRTRALAHNTPGDLETAERVLDELDAIDSQQEGSIRAHIELQRALISAQRGEPVDLNAFDATRGKLSEADALNLDNAAHRMQIRAQLAALLGDRERTLEWLENAVESPQLAAWIFEMPEFAPFLDDPDFEALAQRLQERIEDPDEECVSAALSGAEA